MDRNESRRRQDSILVKQIDYTLKNLLSPFLSSFCHFHLPQAYSYSYNNKSPLQYTTVNAALTHSVTHDFLALLLNLNTHFTLVPLGQ